MLLPVNASLPSFSSYMIRLAWGDFDNDGLLDVVISGPNPFPYGSCDIWRNQGNGTFAKVNAGLPQRILSAVVWGDFDNDGKLDLILSAPSSYPLSDFTQIWRNQGDGTFSNLNISIPPFGLNSISLSDYDNDGRLDILATTAYTGSIRIWRNLGNGVFTAITNSMPQIARAYAAWGDYDNDGRPDILICGQTGDTGVFMNQIWRNVGNGVFTNINAGLQGLGHGAAAWGDFDNDGKLDVLETGTNGISNFSQIWRNAGNNKFTNININLPKVQNSSVAWGDFENDGRLDFLITGRSSTGLVAQIWKNIVTPTNNPPGAPSGLTASVNAKTVLLSWSAANDTETPSSGLSYNVRVGTVPGGSDLLSSQSDAATGFLRIPQIGNAQQRLSIPLTNLPSSQSNLYYWSVQAVDSGFLGGAFAPEASFFVPPTVPTATTLPPIVVNPLSSVASASVNPNAAGTTVWFQYGTNTNYGSLTPTQEIGDGSSVIVVTNLITNLLAMTTYHYRIVASNSLGIAYGSDQVASTPLFEGAQALLAGVKITSAAWGDFDNDGWLDLLIAGSTSSNSFIQVWRNLGNGTFSDVNANLPGLHAPAVAIGDFDNDGRLDFLLTGENGAIKVSQIWRNLGNGTFTNMNVALPGIWAASLAIRDFDNDGKQDILLEGSTGTNQITQIWHNNGNFVFTPTAASLPRVSTGGVATADFDRDGLLDVVIVGYDGTNNISKLYRNLGDGNFTYIQPHLQGEESGRIACADYDNDGWPDVLINGDNYTETTVYKNRQNGTFLSVASFFPPLESGSALWGDLDNDGKADVFINGNYYPTNAAKIWQNIKQGGSNFTFRVSGITNSQGSAALGDYDNDGHVDLFLNGTNATGQAFQIWHNFNSVTKGIPPTPTGLTMSTIGTSVRLDWEVVAGGTNGYSYNVRAGTSPGGSDVLAAMANPVTGFRLVPQTGNAEGRNWMVLTNLTASDSTVYYWSVQAVDASFVGGPFAQEQSFVIGTNGVLPQIVLHSGFGLQSGSFGFDVTGQSGQMAIIEASTNLQNWTAIWSNVLGSNPSSFSDPQAGGYSNRFYRARLLQ